MVNYGSTVLENKKREYLEEAEKTLSYSILQNPRMHLLAFSTRMKVYMELSSLHKFTAERKEDYLLKALDDGKISINSNLSANDACTVADVCQRLAKFPNVYVYGPEAVSNPKYLNEALDYLNQCISANGQTYFTAFRIGTIYFDMGEYRIATEWLKRAFMCSDYTRSFENIKKLCMSVLKLGEDQHVNVEFIHVLTYIASKMNDLKFINYLVPKRLWENYLGRLWEFMKFLETFDLTAHQVKIAEYLKTVLTEKDFLTARRLRICRYKQSTRYDLKYDLNAASLLHVDIGSADVPHICKYDYFIIMSGVNSGWIQCFLQHQLGIQMIDHDTCFTGWPGSIELDSCSSLLETTTEGIKECKKSILVLSKDFLKREWCVLKKIITETMKIRSDFLRIILLDNCDIPPEIDSERLSFFDFTDDKNIPIEIQHLKLALLEN
ncbi:unnamed protein product [Mytilus coruscus]|uniref:TIR domain-containing protein n=1 Tax=Mytilus coruscus TaxID=42192 RepID=A0A6J8CMD4_MYTCO|nr:unnamed protein product [Mytilus coruscus]